MSNEPHFRFTSDKNKSYWMLSSPEMESGKAQKHNDPHEVELCFTGSDGSKWKATKWELCSDPFNEWLEKYGACRCAKCTDIKKIAFNAGRQYQREHVQEIVEPPWVKRSREQNP